MKRSLFLFALLIPLALIGCGSYTGQVEEGFYQPRQARSVKLPFKVALIVDQGFSQQQLSLPNNVASRSEINLQPGLTNALTAALSQDFDEATVVDDPTKSNADFLVYPTVQFTWWQAQRFSDLPTIKNTLELTFKDHETGQIVEYFHHEAALDDPERGKKDLALSVGSALTLNLATLPVAAMKGNGDAASAKATIQQVFAANLDAISDQILESRALAARASDLKQAVARAPVSKPAEPKIGAVVPPKIALGASNSGIEHASAVSGTTAAALSTTGLKTRRLALVIGNSKYDHVAMLANPANDAHLIAATLKDLGFELVGGGPLIDLNKPEFEDALQKFGDEIHQTEGEGSTALFYYAGHGMQIDGTNFLVPVSANPNKASDAPLQMVSADAALSQMQDGGAQLKIMILDACRDNPFPRGSRSTGGGLAPMEAAGALISYSTQAGTIAGDGKGADSLYTDALARIMRTPGLDLYHVFNSVALEVEKKTGGDQVPYLYVSPIEGDFYFASGPSH